MQTSAEYQCPRHATVTYMPVNVRAYGRHLSSGCQMTVWLVEPSLSVSAVFHVSVFLKGTPRAFSREVQWLFVSFEGHRCRPASTNVCSHSGEIGGHEGWICHGVSYRKIKPTRPQHGNSRPRTWVSLWTLAYGMWLLQQITSAAPEAFYQCVCECELEATVRV
jgi:hypothetical protein